MVRSPPYSLIRLTWYRGHDMPLPAQFDLNAFLDGVDRDPQLRGVRVVYFDGYGVTILRDGPPYCAPGLLAIVIRDDTGGDDVVLRSPVAAQTRDGKALFEILGAGLSCSSAVLGWVVAAGSAGAAPVTGGTSVFLTYLSIGAATASSIQCVNAVARVGAEFWAPEQLDILDKELWYQRTNTVLDGISLVGAAASTAVTLRMALRLRTATGKTMITVLKGLSRQERRALAEEVVRIENPGISNQELKALVRAGLYPKRFTGLQVSQAVRNQLKDALGAAITFTGSATSGLVRQFAVGLARSVDTYEY